MPLEEWASEHFLLKRKGAFKKTSTVDKMLRWKKKLIKLPLTKLDSGLSKAAIQAFKNMVSYMKDRASDKAGADHILKLLENVRNGGRRREVEGGRWTVEEQGERWRQRRRRDRWHRMTEKTEKHR